ncbi:hypothetical protein H0B56_01390 [Haloechinothrix sp. YIM 98757]|uniref:PPE family protein n=1 Tax=Haloechinothrix aidingensis TaxID=2752311 RepID=A0A838A7Q5_9PSEU|nr:hypothetical protein [Haloechinothrix aidingensis]MBA0124192.1 hypothetical protein [Haloechinothrix aidingensis]
MGEQEPGPREYEADVQEQAHDEALEESPSFGGPVIAEHLAQREAARYRDEQERSLAQGQDTRDDAPYAGSDYQGYSHEQLYQFAHHNMSPEDIHEKGRVANEFGNWLSDVAQALSDAANAEQGLWQGEAADAAHGFFRSAATWSDTTAQGIHLGSNRLAEEAEAASTGKNAMPEPTGFDQSAELSAVREQASAGDAVGAATRYLELQRKQEEAQEKHAEAARVMHELDSGYQAAAAQQPAFTAPPDLAGGTDGATHSSFAGGTAGGGVPTAAGGNVPAPGAGVASGAGGAGAAPAPGAQSAASHLAGSGTGQGAGTGSGAPGAARPGAMGGMPLGGAGTSGGDGDRTRGGPRAGTPRGGYAGQRVSGGSGGQTAGGRPGSGASGRAAGQASGQGAPARGDGVTRGGAAAAQQAAGGSRAGGMAGGGAGRGAGKDDSTERGAAEILKNEHLFETTHDGDIERDPDTGNPIVPPVIGESSPTESYER